MRRNAARVMAGGIMSVLAAAPAVAEPNEVRGRALAEETCSDCHDISPEGAFKTYPPSFASIAVFRDRDQIAARILFPQLHSPMPQSAYYLTPADVQDLVVFIQSLEPSSE